MIYQQPPTKLYLTTLGDDLKLFYITPLEQIGNLVKLRECCNSDAGHHKYNWFKKEYVGKAWRAQYPTLSFYL